MADRRRGQPGTPRSGDAEQRDSRLGPAADRAARPVPRPGTPAEPRPESETGGTGPPTTERDASSSVGELISDVTSDLARLVGNEFALAKAELKEEGREAGRAAGMYGGAGYAAGLALLLASLAAVYGLAHVIGLAWAALVMAAVWAVAGAALYAVGRKRMRSVQPTPERAKDSLREDVKWARHPTS
ncbi:phage holin family protein [Streptomyces ochraceiscleroticus]|uniref:Phage holin family protein n=1 Tax=Streptomyces ochraceiscleroticus TaxID=47761 RepID=A0ABW1MHF5_9ACTN|nr:phage holin family protein [Streptomyces ochraceiscleroticus]